MEISLKAGGSGEALRTVMTAYIIKEDLMMYNAGNLYDAVHHYEAN